MTVSIPYLLPTTLSGHEGDPLGSTVAKGSPSVFCPEEMVWCRGDVRICNYFLGSLVYYTAVSGPGFSIPKLVVILNKLNRDVPPSGQYRLSLRDAPAEV
jgi:hypothetical protein